MSSPGAVAARWIESFLVHSQGDYHGQPFRVHPFQRDFLEDLYAVDKGRRRVRRALLGMPKGNGKTELAAAIACLEAAGPFAPSSPDVIVVAASMEQAAILFDSAKAMISGGPLRPFFELYDSEIIRKDGSGRIRRIAANYSTADGLRPTAAIFDEVHEFTSPQTARTHLVVSNGLVKRASGTELNITTAGSGMNTLLGNLFQVGKEGNDPTYLFRWYAASDDHDLATEAGLRAALREANPAIAAGFLSEDRLVARFREVPEHEFERYYLNRWVDRPDRALPEAAWQACAEPARPITGDVVLALDASFRRDATALIGATVEERPHLFVVKIWEQPEGDFEWRVPVGEVIDTIVGTGYTVREVAFDPTFGWTSLMSDLARDGLDERVVEWPTGVPARIGPAWLHFRDAVMDRGLTHDGDETLARHVSNLVLKIDRFGERPTRDRTQPRSFIDAGIAAIVAFDRASALAGTLPEPESVYNERDLLVLG